MGEGTRYASEPLAPGKFRVWAACSHPPALSFSESAFSRPTNDGVENELFIWFFEEELRSSLRWLTKAARLELSAVLIGMVIFLLSSMYAKKCYDIICLFACVFVLFCLSLPANQTKRYWLGMNMFFEFLVGFFMCAFSQCIF